MVCWTEGLEPTRQPMRATVRTGGEPGPRLGLSHQPDGRHERRERARSSCLASGSHARGARDRQPLLTFAADAVDPHRNV